MSVKWYSLSIEEINKRLDSSVHGLTSSQAREKLQKYGSNVLPEKRTESIFKAIFSQANNLLNYVLIAAVIFSALSSHWVDFWVILIILILNTAISTYHHINARKVVDSLSKGFKEDALVLRDGKFIKLPAEELVPGDVVNLKDGDKFPADIRFIQANGVSCAEASLTGESTSVAKNTASLPENTPLAYQSNMGFKGTIMLTGEAQVVVVETGSETQIGKIAIDLKNIKEEKTLFEKRTERLIKQMVLVTAVTSLTILTLGYFRGIETSELVLFVLAALISGIPEGLPTVLMVVLSIAAFRMSRRKVILKKLKAIESLSSVTTIVTDKTGTLTENTMNVGLIRLADGKEVKVSGTGWKPEGDFLVDGRKIQPLDYPVLKKLLEMSGFNDQADVVKTKSGYDSIGDPTEASRIVMSRKAKVTPQYLAQKYLLVTSTTYDQQTKYRQNIVKVIKDNVYYLVVVGGAENVIKRCNRKLVEGKEEEFNKSILNYELDMIKNYAGQAYRMQAVAYSKLDSRISEQIEKKQLAGEKLNEILIPLPLVYLGSLAINDPVRVDVPGAVASAQKAGIRVVMATGDHPDTAKAVGQICGIDQHGQVLTESEIENISDKELLEKLQTVRIFARMTPSGKKRIANLLQTSGELIAMTGDGTNDAPALKSADVGIAMGEIGTDAAREASDLIILDDNFATIVSAIEEGRTVFRNVRQTSLYLLTTNFAEDLLLVFALVLKMPLPLLPLQILWLNLVTDGVSGVSLATEKPQATTLTSPPRKRTEGILGRKNLVFIGVVAVVMMVLSLGIFTWGLRVNEDYARTVTFTFLVFCQLFNMINLRSLDLPISKIGFFSNKAINISFTISTGLLFVILYVPFLRDIFRFTLIELTVVLILFALSFLIFITGEVLKRAKLIV